MKGQITTTMVLYVVKFTIISLVIFLLKGVVPYIMVLHVDTHDVESKLFVHQLLTTPQGLAYENEGYISLGVIDPGKITGLPQRLSYGKHLAAKLVLRNATDSLVKEGFFQKERYELWSVFLGKRGPGGTEEHKSQHYVLYQSGGEMHPGRLTVSVVMPHG